MNKSLDDQPFCMGVNLSLADVAVGCALGYLDLRFPELTWRSKYANLHRLVEKLHARPSFLPTLPPQSSQSTQLKRRAFIARLFFVRTCYARFQRSWVRPATSFTHAYC